MDWYTKITVKPTTVGGKINSMLSRLDHTALTAPPRIKKEYIGFCLNCDNPGFIDDRKEITRDRSIIDCPDCGHALLWKGKEKK